MSDDAWFALATALMVMTFGTVVWALLPPLWGLGVF